MEIEVTYQMKYCLNQSFSVLIIRLISVPKLKTLEIRCCGDQNIWVNKNFLLVPFFLVFWYDNFIYYLFIT